MLILTLQSELCFSHILNISYCSFKNCLNNSFFKFILKLLIDPKSLIFEGKPFHSFAMRYWKDFCPVALVKGGRFM